MFSKKTSVFINEEEFGLEEVIDINEDALDDDFELPVEFPHHQKATTAEIIRNVTGSPLKKLHETLPDLIELYGTPSTHKAIERPKSLTHIKNCPRCTTPLTSAISVSGVESSSFLECPSCGTLVNTFKPIAYQAEFAKRNERYLMLSGGFGSGKSRINIEKIISHLLLLPKARVVVSAKTYPAIEATFVKDFFSVLPTKLIRRKNEQKKEWILTNGSELLLRSFDDPTKLRGINASMFVLLEASNIPYTGFELAQNRIRNTAALLPQYDLHGNPVYKYDEKTGIERPVYRRDARKILIETNPDAGWVKKEFLLNSHEVMYYGSAHREGYNMSKTPDKNKFTLVMATDANPYLPENYIAEQTKGKSRAYVLQFFYGSFNFSEGLVYPDAGACIVSPHALPQEYDEQGKRALWYVIGLDYGISDALAIIYGAYSRLTKKLYFFDEIYKSGLDVKTAVRLHREKLKLHKITNDKLMFLPLFDGRSYNKREASLQTVGDLFNVEGLYFTPSFTNIDARITKFNGMIKEGDVEIFSNLEFLIEEITNYKFKPNKDGTLSNKPYDKDNHAINAGEFIVMALPLNLKSFDMSAYVPQGTIHLHDKEEKSQEIMNTYNPYIGGNKNDRCFVNHTNNRYGGKRSSANKGVQEAEGNIFKAYIP